MIIVKVHVKAFDVFTKITHNFVIYLETALNGLSYNS